ncbi:MAG: hypothetical protein DVB23_002952 [Verrucomicrobia bacterium]|nr:MAG: hypothetical protein DVB23_002952 [Verrucomicrobiota bacterium]
MQDRNASAGLSRKAIPCLECGHSLKPALAGRGLAFHILHCGSCAAFWLPGSQTLKIEPGAKRLVLSEISATLFRREKAAARKSATEADDKAKADADRAETKTRYNQISQRKIFYEISPELTSFLTEFGRSLELPPVYDMLLEFSGMFSCQTPDGGDSLWKTVTYDPDRTKELNRELSRIYSLLKTGKNDSLGHLSIERIDYCEFGNSKPFRVRVVNQFNDNYDHFYVKVPDASRIFGLELEHALSPNRINYLVHQNSLIEEHIAGVPGDAFIREHLDERHLNRVRVAKEFVKFTERCFIRLLGDMRTYNYVVDITPDFEEVQFRVRAIDFDQQSYEGDLHIYLPQFFRENALVVKLCTDLLNYQTMRQYQVEERSLMARRLKVEHQRIDSLFKAMKGQPLSSEHKIAQLREELNEHHQCNFFQDCQNMAALVEANLQFTLAMHP